MIINKLDNVFYYHFFNGTLNNIYDYLGTHVYKEDDKVVGAEFLTYAPNAIKVSLICEYNGFKEVFLKEIKHGFFYLNLRGDLEGCSYKYVIYTKQNEKLYKADPFAFKTQLRPNNNSVIYDLQEFDYYKKEIECQKELPITIYEVHLASWRKNKQNEFLSYLEVTNDLITYLKDNNFTHVEFLPIQEHPLDDSWGYMTTGYYAPTARHGEPHFLKQLINELQKNNIGVILDWVPGHICKDSFGLYKYDGTHLFEYNDELKRENVGWGTANLDLSKSITKNFLISNALYWIKYYNVDGFRVDAVNNLIYYLGDKSKGVNKDAIIFMQELSNTIKQYKENILLIAEDSSSFPKVTTSSYENGLGFDFKWNMGWMNDSLKYFSLDSYQRKYNHNLLTFGFTYVYSEKFILAISHDEVVHLKKSLYNKMPGNYYEKFSNMRSYLGFMLTHPGKKLLFMGCEFAQDSEWNFKEQVKFDLYNEQMNNKLNLFLKDLSKMYLNEEILYKTDNDAKSLVFIDADNKEQSLYIFCRVYNNSHIMTILNASNQTYYNQRIGVLKHGSYVEVINSDNEIYGGSNIVNNNIIVEEVKSHNQEQSILLNIAAFTTIIIKCI